MDETQKFKIRKNYTILLNNLQVEDFCDNLFSKHVIEFDDIQRVRAEVTDRDKAKRLIDILLTTKGSFNPFLEELKLSRYDLYEIVEKTDVEKELKKEKQNISRFLRSAIRRRFMFSFGMTVTESDAMFVIGHEYWRDGRGELPKDISYRLFEAIPKAFKEGTVKRISTVQNGQTIWMYTNIELTPSENSERDIEYEEIDLEESTDTDNAEVFQFTQ
uniref:Uncharacterized protein LOC111112688 isoform X2 n=1 Tax=Crassostrea virginica TaxID=6565 RepID=A0A8B8BS04_CRAVI|nr:uncharacterized protein LOC111112688 isoform X2 [Crassostrea virginica]